MSDFKKIILENINDEDQFVQAVFSGRMRGHECRWQRLVIRPVMLQDQRHLQFSFYDATQNFTYNYQGEEAVAQLHQVLALPFRNYHIHMVQETMQINLTKKGKAIIGRSPLDEPRGCSLNHDYAKNTILQEGVDIPFLRAIGLTRHDNRVKASMRSKYRQINAFLQLLADIPDIQELPEPLFLVDFGCGNAYLTFATYHYLHHILGKNVSLVGVDQRADLIERNQKITQQLGWSGLHFESSSIAEYVPPTAPAIVIALHACDIATDDALAQGIRYQSKIIIAAPCCHHELQVQLRDQPAPAGLDPIMRHGLWQERIGDILTDSFRALILRIMGYQVSVLEFVSPDHTPKNVLLRAIRRGEPGYRPGIAEYRELLDYWSVQPYLHQLLSAELDPYLAH